MMLTAEPASRHAQFAIRKTMDRYLMEGTPKQAARSAGVGADEGRLWMARSRRRLPAAGGLPTSNRLLLRRRRRVRIPAGRGVNSVDRFALLDAVADLLEDSDAGALVDRRAGGASEAVELRQSMSVTSPSSAARYRMSACPDRSGKQRGLERR